MPVPVSIGASRSSRLLRETRVDGPAAYQTRLAELELLAAAKVADLLAPGSTLVKRGRRLRRHLAATLTIRRQPLRATQVWPGLSGMI